MALSDAAVDLIEVAGASEVLDPDSPAMRTGVWIAFTTENAALLPENLMEGETQTVVSFSNANGLWTPGALASKLYICWTSSFRVYPYLTFAECGPNFPLAGDMSKIEWLEGRCMYSFLPSGTVAAAPMIVLVEPTWDGEAAVGRHGAQPLHRAV